MEEPRKALEPQMKDLHRLSASEVLPLLRGGSLSVEQYARSLIEYISARDSLVHAWAFLDPEHILKQAKKLDQIPNSERGPLHGLPVGIKDILTTEDMPTRYFSPIHKDQTRSSQDATSVLVLRSAGALIFGKTATTEFAASSEGGPCANPHNLDHTPGGSSSGSAAAVADFQVPVAIGTQTGGSVIRPGAYTGIFALKPTFGVISTEGMAHFSPTCDTVGFFARTVQDLDLLAEVFRLPGRPDKGSEQIPKSLSSLKVAFIKSPAWVKAGPGLEAVWSKAISLSTRTGASVEEVELPAKFTDFILWHHNITNHEARASFLGNYLFAKDLLHHTTVKRVEDNSLDYETLLQSYDGAAALRPVWDKLAINYDIIITPSATDEPPSGLGFTGDLIFCAMWTLLHVPMISIPRFTGKNNLPIGLSIVGARYHDHELLQVAKYVGKLFEED